MSDTPTPAQAAEKAIREMPVVAHMRADGSEWSGYGSCRPGDVESFAVVRLSDAESQLADLRAEVERLRLNDARYRWLRDEADPDREDTGLAVSESDFNDWGNPFTRYFSGDALDAAIDKAIGDKENSA
ncbi:hypothetical protein [Variovorax sp. 160MFSha2.1]|uniref:hypothetical protein n=1 Tax=Variovorax sp. 160MFSha2.1 TaxID=3158367 RepID=UPI003AB02236